VKEQAVAYPDGIVRPPQHSRPNRFDVVLTAEADEARLQVSPEYLQFAQTASGLLPAAQSLRVASSTGAAISFSIAETIPWLSVAATGGTAGATPFTTQVTVDTTGLTPAGSPYIGRITTTNQGDPADVRTYMPGCRSPMTTRLPPSPASTASATCSGASGWTARSWTMSTTRRAGSWPCATPMVAP